MKFYQTAHLLLEKKEELPSAREAVFSETRGSQHYLQQQNQYSIDPFGFDCLNLTY